MQNYYPDSNVFFGFRYSLNEKALSNRPYRKLTKPAIRNCTNSKQLYLVPEVKTSIGLNL